MHFIGLDLAWGERKPSGVAVLDDDGRLLQLCAAQTDDEILAAVRPYTRRACLVGIDAPLTVENATGNRPAETALNRDFARFDAGAHPVNTGKPEFSDTPRSARLAAALGLDINPRSRRARRAIEVYPHAAIVALFRLGRTLKYKNKPGRDVTRLRSELLTLMGLVESLHRASPSLSLNDSWVALRGAVQSATRKSELRVVEDQVDAVVCAYVALYAVRRPELTTSYGDAGTGYIVTPTLPTDLEPTPKRGPIADPPTTDPLTTDPSTPDPLTTDPLVTAVAEYAAQQPELIRAGQQFVELVTAILDDAGINYLTVVGRTKSVASFAEKAGRAADGVRLYPDPIRDMGDLIGLRVITYVQSDVAAVADLLHAQLVVHQDRDMGLETAREGRFGYASRHLQLSVDPDEAVGEGRDAMRGRVAQVQIRTVLQHAWAEFEHDIRYKGTMPDEHAREFDRRFTLAAGLLELADREFSTIRDRLRTGQANRPAADRPAAQRPAADRAGSDGQAGDPRLEPRELAAFLAGQYADAGWSRTEHYSWISGLLLELGITSLDELAEVIRSVDEAEIGRRMDYRYPPGAVRRLDDALLARFGDSYLRLHGNADRRVALQTRHRKLDAELPGQPG